MINLFIALFLLFASPALAAIAEVGGGSQRATVLSNSTQASVSLVFPGSVTSGNMVCAAGNMYSGTSSVGVTDTRGTSYSVFTLNVTNNTNYRVFLACGNAPSSGANTVTVTPDISTSFMAFAIDEFSGQDSSSFLDADGGSSHAISTAPADTITTTVANALLLAVLADDGSANSAIDAGSGWTVIGEEEGGTTIRFNFMFKIATTATSYTADYTIVENNAWEVYTISIKPAVVGGGGGTRKRVVFIQ